MSDLEKKSLPQTVTEPAEGKDPYKQTATGIETVLRKSGGTAIINVGDTDQPKVVETLGLTYEHWTTEDILTGKISPTPLDKKGLVVSGYDATVDEEKENLLQAVVRQEAFRRESNRRMFSVVVLSSSLPDPNVFDASKPWFNGPFEDNTSWTVAIAEGVVKISQHKLKRNPEGQKVWVEKEVTELPSS